MKTPSQLAAATAIPAAAPAAPAQAQAPEATGNISLSQLASSFTSKRASRSSTPAAATPPAQPQPAASAAANGAADSEHPAAPNAEAETEFVETELQAIAEEDAAEATPPPEGESPEDTAGEGTGAEEGDPEAAHAPDLSAAETDAMTDAEFAEYVSQLTENKAQKKMLQRIHRLTWRLRQAEGQPRPNAPTPEHETPPPLPNNPLLQQINSDLQSVNQALTWVDENPDGGEFTDPRTGKAQTYSAAQVRTIRRNAESARAELISERSTTLSQLRQADAAIRTKSEADFAKAYPQFAREGTPEAVEFATLMRQAPELQRFPDYKLWLAWSIEGRKAYEARLKARPKVGQPMTRPRGSTEPPPVAVRPVAGAPRVNGRQKEVVETEKQFQSTGKLQDLAKMFSKRRDLRRQPA